VVFYSSSMGVIFVFFFMVKWFLYPEFLAECRMLINLSLAVMASECCS
jgi:hypothetical protein